MGDVAVVVVGAVVVADVAHTKEHSGVALGGTAVEDLHSTSGNSVAAEKLARHTSYVDHVQKGKQLMLESWTEECGRRWVGMVASFERQP